MLKLLLEESVAEDVFEVLHSLLEEAKNRKEKTIISYVAPILVKYGCALIDAKGNHKSSRNKLINVKKLAQLN